VQGGMGIRPRDDLGDRDKQTIEGAPNILV